MLKRVFYNNQVLNNITSIKKQSLWYLKQQKSNLFVYLFNKMNTNKESIVKPPESVRNMTKLNKLLFTKEVTIPIIDIKDAKVSAVLPCLKKYLLKIEHQKAVINSPERTIILLNPTKLKTWNDIELSDQELLKKLNIIESDFLHEELTLKYDNFSAEDVLRSVLPLDKEGVASFTKIGHIVHVNLRDHLLPFKMIIGEVLFDKVSGCRTVVNKIDMIDNTYRNFQMEVLCGESDFMAKLKENKCQFEFDFSTVYWNSRLCTEHERIVNLVKTNDVFFDVFAGVGPFSIPIAKKKNIVFANDLNPESYKWLQHNAKINKIGNNLHTFNKDGRDFIINDLKIELLKHINTNNIHITMNLPAMAVEFLSAFNELFKDNEINDIINPPLVYVYCFAKGENYIKIAKDLVIKNFGFDVSEQIIDIFKVRTVSSMKEMMRVTIKLDKHILIGNNKRKLIDGDLKGADSNKKTCHGEKQTEKV